MMYGVYFRQRGKYFLRAITDTTPLQVYAVKTTWSDGQVNIVSRRYSEFYKLMKKLDEVFPAQVGKTSKERIIPTLQANRFKFPGKHVSMKKLDSVSSFTEKLFHLPQDICQSQFVLDFFTPTEEDLQSLQRKMTKRKKRKKKKSPFKELSITGPVNFEEYYVIEDLKKQFKNGLDLKKGQVVEVIEKSETGWWLICADGEQGWTPASYLSNEEQNHPLIKYEPGSGEIYVSTKKYKAEQPDELSFDVGVHLQIIEKNYDGWWKALYCGREGMVPCTYLKLIGQMNHEASKEVREIPHDFQDEDGSERRDSRDSIQIKNDKIIKMVKRDSLVKWTCSIDDNILKKLRDSTLPSPEEEKRINQKNQPAKPRTHLDLRTSNEGGWVPQVIPRANTYSHNRPEPMNPVSKRFNFSKFKSKSNKEKDHNHGQIENSSSCPNLRKNCLDQIPRANTYSHDTPKQANTERNRLSFPKKLIKSKNTKKDNCHFVSQYEASLDFTKNRQLCNFDGINNINVNDVHKLTKDNQQLPLLESVLPFAPDASKESLDSGSPLSCNSDRQQVQDVAIDQSTFNSSQRGHKKPVTLGSAHQMSDEFCMTKISRSVSCPSLFQPRGEAKKPQGNTNSVSKTRKDTMGLRFRRRILSTGMQRQMSKLPDISNTRKPRSLTCPDSTLQHVIPNARHCPIPEDMVSNDQKIVPTFLGVGIENEFNLSNSDSSITSSSSEQSLFTLQELEAMVPRHRDYIFSESDSSDNDSGVYSTDVSPGFTANGTMYVAIADFKGSRKGGEIDLIKGQRVLVLKKIASGWWYVDAEERGWAPSNFLKEQSEDFNFTFAKPVTGI